MEPVIVDPNAVVKEMEPIFRRILGEEVGVEVTESAEPLTILVDPAELERAILNLAINARDAMPRGGRFTIRSERLAPSGDEGPSIAISVADTGVGMDPAVAEHCFEPLFTTKPSGQGTGLGLTAVHAAVSQAGGRVTIDTAPELGTTFTLIFPWADGTVAPPEPDEALVSGGEEVLLLVEDEIELRELAERELSWRGYTVVAAASGLDALAAAERIEGRFDLLVTDIAMPGMSGLELSGKLVARWGVFPILYVSGHIDRATLDAHELDGEGVSALAKPFTPEQLARRVRRALEVA
jgi:two-component system, cell cycle sensor histidine kinase and response regulator CckA